jgi:hypothetical protein
LDVEAYQPTQDEVKRAGGVVGKREADEKSGLVFGYEEKLVGCDLAATIEGECTPSHTVRESGGCAIGGAHPGGLGV